MTLFRKMIIATGKIKTIAITGGEFDERKCPMIFDNLSQAMGKMSVIARSTRPGIGYTKVDFKVTFNDDSTYSGRFDLKENGRNCENKDIMEQVQSVLHYFYLNPHGQIQKKMCDHAEITLRNIFEYDDKDFETLKRKIYA